MVMFGNGRIDEAEGLYGHFEADIVLGKGAENQNGNF